MRVLHVSPGLSWRGGQNQTRLLMKVLRERPDVEQRIVAVGGTAMEREARELGVPCLPVRRRLALDPDLIGALARAARDHDVFHAHGSHAVQAAVAALALRGGTARLVSARRVEIPLRSPGVWRRSDLILAVSSAVRRSLLARGLEPDRVRVVHDGVDVAEARAGDEEAGDVGKAGRAGDAGRLREAVGARTGELLVGAVGALEREKGHRTLVRAAARVVERAPGARFVIAGEGEERERLERLVGDLGLGERFALPGHVPDVRRSLADLDLFVMPSLQEGLGSATLEALAAELPVIVSRTGGLVDVAGDTLPAVPPGDARALADAMLRLLEDGEERRRVARAGAERLEKFTASVMADRTLRAYRDVLRRDARERAIVRRYRVGRA